MRRQNDQRLGDVLKEWLDQSPIKTRIYQSKIEAVWRTKMGATISQYTTGISLVRKKLFLTVSSSSLRQELAFSREKIRDMVNEELGERWVEEVIIS